MAGKCYHIACAALVGILLSLEYHLLTLILASIVIVRVIQERNKHLLILFCSIMFLFIILGLNSEKDKRSSFSEGNIHDYVTFQESPEIDGNRLRAIVTTSNEEKLMLSHNIQNEKDKYRLEDKLVAGSSCRTNGELVIPLPNSNEHAFNYQRYLYRQNIHWQLEVEAFSIENCSVSGRTIKHVFQNIREKGIKTVAENFPEKVTPYANALIFGERSDFANETYRAYQEIGVVHLLAISGLHIGLLVGILYFCLLRIGMTKETVFWLLCCILPIYTILSGGNPPVIRAVIMSLLLLAKQKWRLPYTTFDAFSISFIVFLFFDPYLIYHVGFQLTYSVSFALIISSQQILRKKTSSFKNMFDISVVSMLASLPILAFHFYEFSLISIVSNIVYVPFYTIVILPLMFFLFILQFIHWPLFVIFSEWTSRLLLYSEQIAKYGSTLKFAMITVGKPDIIMMVLMIIGVFLFLLFNEQGKSYLYSACPLILVFFISFLVHQFPVKGEVIFIDVGQGDSILIKLPYNRGTYLIDTGGTLHFPVADWQERSKSFKVGEDVLLPLLKSKKINKIDKLILTHSDVDHMGAAQELLGRVMIKEILISPNSWEKKMMADLVTEAQSLGISVKQEKAGSSWQNKSGEFHFLYPFDDEYEGNNDSLVLYGVFGGLSWIFTGDLEKEGEEEFIKRYGDLRADVLKVGHHGSNSSTTSDFLALLQPKYSIISAGRNNRYGHPHAEVIAELQASNTSIFQTGEHGAIHYEFTKKGGTFRTQWQYDKAIEIQE